MQYEQMLITIGSGLYGGVLQVDMEDFTTKFLSKELSRNNFSKLLREMPYTQAFPEARVQSYL